MFGAFVHGASDRGAFVHRAFVHAPTRLVTVEPNRPVRPSIEMLLQTERVAATGCLVLTRL